MSQSANACRSVEMTSKSEEDKQLLSNLDIDPKTIREYKQIGFFPNNISSLTIIFNPLSNDNVYNFWEVTCKVNTTTKIWTCKKQLLTGFDVEDSYVYTNIDIEKQDLIKLKEAFTNSIRIKEHPKKGMAISRPWNNFSITGNSNKLTLHEQSCHENWITYKKKIIGKEYFYKLEETNEFISI